MVLVDAKAATGLGVAQMKQTRLSPKRQPGYGLVPVLERSLEEAACEASGLPLFFSPVLERLSEEAVCKATTDGFDSFGSNRPSFLNIS